MSQRGICLTEQVERNLEFYPNLVGLPHGGYTLAIMSRNVTVNPTSQHELYLKLFITNGGGW